MTKRRDLLFSAAILLIIAVWFFDVLFLGRGFYLRDLTSYHYPMKSVVRETILRGEFPWWNPLHGGGQPIAANPAYELFYPPQLLVLLPDYLFGYQLHILVHFAIAALGMYALLRSLGAKQWASAIGGLSFALGGATASTVNLLPFLFAFSWVPLILLFARRFVLTRRGTDLLLAALFLGIQGLVGEPVVALQTYALIGAGAIYYGWIERDRWPAIGKNILMVGVLIACGLAIAAVQLLPAIDHAGQTVRVRGMPFELVAMWSMHPARLLEFAFPALYRNMTSPAGPTVLDSFYGSQPFLGDFYVGAVIAIAAIAGLFSGFRHRWATLGLAAGFFILALGAKTPLLRVLYDLHVFRSIRYPEKFALGLSFVLIVWGSLVVDRFFSSLQNPKEKRLQLSGWFLAWGIGAIVLTVILGGSATTPDQKNAWLLLALRGFAAIALGAFVIRRFPKHVPALLALLVLADVFYLQKQMMPRMPRVFFEPPPAAAQLPDRTDYRILHGADWEWIDATPQAEAYFADQSTYWWTVRNGGFPRVPWSWGRGLALNEDVDRTDLLPAYELLESVADVKRMQYAEWEGTFSSMANVHYVARFRPFEAEKARTGGDMRNAQPVDFVATTPAPRFYFARRLAQIADRNAFVQRILERKYLPGDAMIFAAPFQPAAGHVVSVNETSHSVTLTVEAAGRSFLVATITPQKYWRAFIDGAEAPLQRVNIAFQGLEVPAGRHTVELRYHNPLVVRGAAVSGLALLALAGWAAFDAWRRRRIVT